MSNDTKISQLRQAVETKRSSLGDKPRLAYVTNALFTIDGERVNLNTLNEAQCVDLVSRILAMTRFSKEANELLGTNIDPKLGDFTVDQWIGDIKMRVSLLQWESEKKKLAAMDHQLKNLMSDDAKTAEALESIAAQLDG